MKFDLNNSEKIDSTLNSEGEQDVPDRKLLFHSEIFSSGFSIHCQQARFAFMLHFKNSFSAQQSQLKVTATTKTHQDTSDTSQSFKKKKKKILCCHQTIQDN